MVMSAIIVVVIGLVVGVIGLQIVAETLTSANFTGLTATVTNNIPVLFGVGLLILSIGWAATQM